MIRRHTADKQRGDTIVEVLISMAVVSLILAGAYASATHDTSSIQDAQEHGQALQLAQRQLEFLKTAGGDDFKLGGPVAGGCFRSDGTKIAPGPDKCLVQPSGEAIPDPDYQPAFRIAITQDGTDTGPFTVAVTWDSLVNNGNGQLMMYYRP